MKPTIFYACLIAIGLMVSCQSSEYKTINKTDSNGFRYQMVKGDPMNARIYTLDNGMKVYLARNTEQPQIMTLISFRAGSKDDPRETTGLAHYFEHILFKGTRNLGTTNWEEESKLIEKISDLFEEMKDTPDPNEEALIYKKIDSLSYEAAKYAIPNEYDKLLSTIGAEHTNAFTSYDMTTYINQIPSNELERWLWVESDRFENLVMRLFHTELETVYEEFNMVQDNDHWNARMALHKLLFEGHPYEVSVIGKGEHLKNPSKVSIENFRREFYVANNMAICLMGDLDFEATIQQIDQYWGSYPKNPEVEHAVHPPLPPIEQVVETDVFGPNMEFVNIGYRAPSNSNPDGKYLDLISRILNNGQAGLIDLNLVKNQMLLRANCFYNSMNDHGTFILTGTPRQGQSLEEVKDLLIAEVEKVKQGEFDEWLIEAVINNMKLQELRQNESNWGVFSFMEAFISDTPWADRVSYISRLETVTKDELVEFANSFFGDNYAVVYKRTGENKDKMVVEKPHITPFEVNREDESVMFSDIMAMDIDDLEPVFLNYDEDIMREQMADGIDFYYTHNPNNSLANLIFIVDIGKNHSKKVPIAIDYLQYIGTEAFSLDSLNQELFRIGVDFYASSGNERCYVSLRGLDENMEQGLELLLHILSQPKANQDAYEQYVEGILKQREDQKLNHNTILWSGLYNYAKYGPKSAFTDILSREELMSIDPTELIDIIKGILGYEHKIVYYGPRNKEEAKELIVAQEGMITESKMKPAPEAMKYPELDTKGNQILFCNYDNVQAQVILLSKGQVFNSELLPQIRMFNEYYGGSMSSIVFQELREARGLAYAAWAGYDTPSKADRSNYIFGYIGTQPDKITDALDQFNKLFNDMPQSIQALDASKQAIISRINSERIIKNQLYWDYHRNKELGIDVDPRMEIYATAQDYTMEDMEIFFNNYIKGNQYDILIVGSKDLIDFNALKAYGKITELSLEDVFNY